jgi:hypothetical protein
VAGHGQGPDGMPVAGAVNAIDNSGHALSFLGLRGTSD